MKKILSILSMMLLGGALYAGPVTPEKALQVAQRVFEAAPATKATDPSALQIVWDGEFEPATKAAQDPDFYVVSRSGGGFVMVAGNDNVQPVLAFSFENDFKVEGMPDNVRWWMQQYKDYVRSVGSATPQVRAQWERYEETKATASPYDEEGIKDEFLGSRTNLWNQTNPANYYCPDVEGQTETSVCGCVPLAVAEVMAWFGTANIAKASGTVPEYTYYSTPKEGENKVFVTVPSHELGTEYDWAGMKTLASSDPNIFYNQVNGFNWSQPYSYLYYGAGKNNPSTNSINTLTDVGYSVAHLAYDIGTLLGADYNDGDHTGTGAAPAYIPIKVGPVMGYNKNARVLSKDDYPNGLWKKMMQDEVTKHPVLYSGIGDSGGHAYVADGYATYEGELCFHFNMGWGGRFNGYYSLIAQDDYYYGLCALFDFYPAPESVAVPEIGYSSYYNKDGISKIGGMYYSSGYNTSTLTFNLNGFFNVGRAPFTGELYLVLDSSSGENRKSFFLWDYVNLQPSTGWAESGPHNLDVSSAVLGDQVVAYYKESGKEEMLPFTHMPYTSALTALPVFPAAAIKKADKYHVNDFFEFAITNNSYVHQNSTWKVTAPDGGSKVYDLDDYHVLLTSAGEYKIEATVFDPSDPAVEIETLVTYITVE